MGAIGGKDVAETTRNVMKNLMTNGLAARMNFVGRGGKTAIKNMKLLHVINGKIKIFFCVYAFTEICTKMLFLRASVII